MRLDLINMVIAEVNLQTCSINVMLTNPNSWND